MSIKRRAITVVKLISFVVLLVILRAYAQEPAGRQVAQGKAKAKATPAVPAIEEPGKEEMTDALNIPTDRKAQQSINAAQDLIKEENWGQAATILQKLLESKEDIFVEVERRTKGPDGKEKVARQRTSLRVEANRLLGTMPAQGLAFYELQNGARARADLTQAKQTGNRQQLAVVAQRYFHTAAGAEATELLGTYRLDRGDYRMAALYFERLLGHYLADKLSPVSLYKAALAFRCTGDQAKADGILKQLTKKEPRGLTIGDQQVAWDRLQKEMDQYKAGSTPSNLFDWPTFGGAPYRAAEGAGGAPFLEVKWTQDMHSFGSDSRADSAIACVDRTLRGMDDRQLPILPAFYPIAATLEKNGKPLPLVIYRSFCAIHAVNVLNGKLYWMTTPSNLSIDMVARDPGKWGIMLQWINSYGIGGSNPLLDNSVLGALSTDNVFVYGIDDLPVPPHPQQTMQMQMQGMRGGVGGGFDDYLHFNRLQAFELDSGKLKWELGGQGSDSRNGDKGELNQSFFLSAPLPLGDRLYVLNEKNGELRLVCLDPSKDSNQGENPISWTQTLATVRDKLEVDAGRRIQAAHPAYGEGILVCPTNAGAVLAIDLLTHSLVWAHSYRKIPATDPNQAMMGGGMPQAVFIRRGLAYNNGQPQAASEWHVTAPIIQDGKVVYTPPDGNGVLCLNLRDGTPAWEAPRADDLYLAGVFNGKVLLVGKNHCRALNLSDGKEVWKEKTGTPSGVGTASNNIYYLPLRKSTRTKDELPEVCAVNIDTGKIEKESRSRQKANGSMEIPGNLIFYNGDVISQTAQTVAAYPQLKVKLAQIDERLKGNPNDPIGLTERGELRLDDKKMLQGAVTDLRTALAYRPPDNASPEERKKLADFVPRTRAKLYEAFTELFLTDFSGNEKYLDEFKELCKVTPPAEASNQDQLQAQKEEQRRMAGYLCLLGDGREKQGRLLEAFQAYEEFGGLGGNRDLISVPGLPALHTRPDVWAQGRISAMVAKATPEMRKPLEEKIASEWQNIRKNSDTEKLRQFVRVFGSLFAVGREARLRLAERLIDENAFLEAEMNLLQLRHQDDRTLAARAVDDLAKLMIRKNLLEDAAYYYRILGQDYGQTVIRDGKTGADLFNEQATDKRFLPYLDEPPSPWTGGKVRVKEVPGTYRSNTAAFSLDSQEESLPFFHRFRLSLSGTVNSTQLKLIDRNTGEELWKQEVKDITKIGAMLQSNQNNYRLPHQQLGHLVVLSIGPMVYAFDPIERRIRWDRNLSTPGMGTQNQWIPDGNGNLQVYYPDGFYQKTGHTGPIEPSYVCLINRDSVTAVDPVQGNDLWTKTDVTSHTQVFGDDQYLFLVDVNNGSAVAGSGRALRAHDGAPVTIPDFAALYQRKIALVGRNLLLRDNEPDGRTALRLYDVQTGKDLWKKSFAPNSLDLKSEDPNLVGAVEPANDYKVTVVDLRTRKEVLVHHLLPKDLEKVQDIRLVSDRDRFYIAINKQLNPQQNQNGGFYANVTPGIRSVAVNGNVHAFDRRTGKYLWKPLKEISHQMLIVDQFRDMPVLLFTSRSNRMMRPGFNQGMMTTSFMSIDKRTGKILKDTEYNNDQNQFFALNVNARNGTVELVKQNLSIVHDLDTDDRQAANSDGEPGASATGAAKSTNFGGEKDKIIHGGAIIEGK
jgi:outer membrane protein assembly factor BamB/tetratricopeptide (TPR) repeat protein